MAVPITWLKPGDNEKASPFKLNQLPDRISKFSLLAGWAYLRMHFVPTLLSAS